MNLLINGFVGFFQSTAVYRIFTQGSGLFSVASIDLGTIIMIGIACSLIYLAVVKGFEPLLLLPMAFGMLLANIPGANIMHNEFFVVNGEEHFVID